MINYGYKSPMSLLESNTVKEFCRQASLAVCKKFDSATFSVVLLENVEFLIRACQKLKLKFEAEMLIKAYKSRQKSF